MSAFTYFGEQFSYADEFPRFAYAEFCEALADGEEAGSEQATGAALRLAVQCVAPTDRKRFRAVSRTNNARVEDWLTVFRDWTAAEADRPTELPSDSSSGQSATLEPSASQPDASATPVRLIRPDIALLESRSRASA
jgi:hypothetical protein